MSNMPSSSEGKDPDSSSEDEDDQEISKKKKNKSFKIDWEKVGKEVFNTIVDFFKPNETKVLLARYQDNEGILHLALSALLSTKPEKTYWCKLWRQIDEDMNNKMSFKGIYPPLPISIYLSLPISVLTFCSTTAEFIDFFSIDSSEYSSRLFKIMNTSLTGVVNLSEFISFCLMYLVIDKRMTQEFAFRMLSKRAGWLNCISTYYTYDYFF